MHLIRIMLLIAVTCGNRKSSIISHVESMNTMFSKKGGNALTSEGKQGGETEEEMEKRRGMGEGEKEGGRSAEWC